MSCQSRASIQKFVIYHLIFFFILTPFLASCGGGGSSGGAEGPTPTEAETVADAVEDQNRSAMTAIAQTVEMLTAMDNGRRLIEDTFGTLNPTDAEIEAYAQNNSEDAEDLFEQLDTELEKVRQAADSLVESVEDMQDMEETISSSLYGESASTSEEQSRKMLLTGIELAIGLGVLAAFMGFGLAVAEKSRASEYDGDVGENLKEIINDTGESVIEGGKAAATSVATTVVSVVSGTLGYKNVKVVSDTVGFIDNINTANKGTIALRRCQNNDGSDSEDPSLSFRKNMEVDYESLEAGDIYLGTPDEDSVFHNVPPGNWTFIIFVDGHLRYVTECTSIGEDEPDIIEVEIAPVPIEEIDELLENTPDEIVACSDLSDCEDGYICYLGFCEPKSDFPPGSSDYFGHWHIVEEDTTSLRWFADILMLPTGRYVMQIYMWGTELGGQTQGSWSYSLTGYSLLLIADDGSELISGRVHWENENDFWQTGTWAGSTEQKRFAWLKQDDEDDEDDDCPCDGPTCPTRCP